MPSYGTIAGCSTTVWGSTYCSRRIRMACPRKQRSIPRTTTSLFRYRCRFLALLLVSESLSVSLSFWTSASCVRTLIVRVILFNCGLPACCYKNSARAWLWWRTSWRRQAYRTSEGGWRRRTAEPESAWISSSSTTLTGSWSRYATAIIYESFLSPPNLLHLATLQAHVLREAHELGSSDDHHPHSLHLPTETPSIRPCTPFLDPCEVWTNEIASIYFDVYTHCRASCETYMKLNWSYTVGVHYRVLTIN